MSLKRRRLAQACLLFIATLFLSGTANAATQDFDADNWHTLDKIMASIQNRYDSFRADLSTAADALATTGLEGAKARQILEDLCKKHPLAIDCSTIDMQGIIKTVAPVKYTNVEGADVGDQEQVKVLHSTGKPTLSNLFKAVEGMYVLDFEYPIFSSKGQLMGSVSAIAQPVPLFDSIVKPELSWDASDVWAMLPDGKIIYSRYHADVGENPLSTPSNVVGSTLSSLAKQISGNASGSGKFTNPPVGQSGSSFRKCYWKTISLFDKQWRIILFGELQGD